MLRRPWWSGQLAVTWLHASDEAKAQPSLECIISTLRNRKMNSEEVDNVWCDVQSSTPVWKKKLRGESLSDMFNAISDYLQTEASILMNGSTEPTGLPRFEALTSRLRWFQDNIDRNVHLLVVGMQRVDVWLSFCAVVGCRLNLSLLGGICSDGMSRCRRGLSEILARFALMQVWLVRHVNAICPDVGAACPGC